MPEDINQPDNEQSESDSDKARDQQKSPHEKLMERLPGASPPSETEAEGEGDGTLDEEKKADALLSQIAKTANVNAGSASATRLDESRRRPSRAATSPT